MHTKSVFFLLAVFVAVISLACGATAPVVDPTTQSQPAATEANTDPVGNPAPGRQSARTNNNDGATGLLVGRVITEGEFVTIVGEVQNKSASQWARNLVIVTTYFDVTGKEIYVDEVPSEVSFVEPNGTTPFRVITDKARMSGHAVLLGWLHQWCPGADFGHMGAVCRSG